MGNSFASGYRKTALNCIAGVDLTGYTAIVTGCTTGIGIEIALALTTANANVWITGRKDARLNEVRDELNKTTQSNRVSSLLCDQSSLSSIKAAVDTFKTHSSQLQILVLNAGLMAIPYQLSEEGVDMQFATNHIGHFYLFQLLLPTLLKSTQPTRVISVSSLAAFKMGPSTIDYTRLPCVPEGQYNEWAAYQQSKLANILLAVEISKRYKDQQITAYSCHPGIIKTGLWDSVQKGTTGARFLSWITSPLWKSIQQGAATPTYVAVTPGIENQSGEFFENCHSTDQITKLKLQPTEAEKLWNWTEEFLSKHPSNASSTQ